MLNLHRDKKSQDVNLGEMGRSLVTTGRMVMMRSIGYKCDFKNKTKKTTPEKREKSATKNTRQCCIRFLYPDRLGLASTHTKEIFSNRRFLVSLARYVSF